ncbi:MAG TPA: DNRLRE domain-containing protein [Pyrinomonadaceae bacterium]
MRRLLVLSLCLSLCFSVTATGLKVAPVKQQKVVQASKDNTIIESPNGDLSSGKGATIFVGRTGQAENSIRRGLIAFDISKAIPAGSKILSVKLTMTATKGAGANRSGAGGGQSANRQVTLHRLTSDWGEGASSSEGGRGAPASAGDATWLHSFYPDKLWSQPGGDFVSDESASQTAAAAGVYTFGSTPQMVSDVQGWLDAPKTNYGWLLRGDETEGATAIVFQSRESATQKARPQLTVTYTAPVRKRKR